MHRSRLAAIGIDVAPDSHEREAEFWAAVVGGAVERRDDPNDPNMTVGRPRGLELFVQRIGDEQRRVHLDIETDDLEAEVARLEGLGAQGSAGQDLVDHARPGWSRLLRSGPQGGDFPADAQTWD